MECPGEVGYKLRIMVEFVFKKINTKLKIIRKKSIIPFCLLCLATKVTAP